MNSVVAAAASVELAIEAVIAAGSYAATRGWVPATAGNFSVRAGDYIVMTRTGRDKGALKRGDLAVVKLAAPEGNDLSAEAPLHFARYAADPEVGAVYHIHTPLAAVLGRRHQQDGALFLTGWELQKALAGVTTHEQTVRLPIVLNSQDTRALAIVAETELARADVALTAPGYLVAGHGLYAWGRRPADALRHLEALDALLLLYSQWSGPQS
jgi:methylthioribulose-1-phosphate dehydratase